MDSRNVYEWLWIVSCVGCGNSRIWQIVSDFQTISEAYEFLNDKEKRTKLFNAMECKNADRVTAEQIDSMISYNVTFCNHSFYKFCFFFKIWSGDKKRCRCISF